MKYLLLIFLAVQAQAQAKYQGFAAWVQITNNAATTTITITNAVPANSTVVTPPVFETSSAGMTLTSITDPRGNLWTVLTNNNWNTAHNFCAASAAVTTAYQVNDVITLNWTGAQSGVKFGPLIRIANSANVVDTMVGAGTFSSNVTMTVTTAHNFDCIVGLITSDYVPTNAVPYGLVITNATNFVNITNAAGGYVFNSTAGLFGALLETSETTAGTYTLTGTWQSQGTNQIKSWEGMAVAFCAFTNASAAVIGASTWGGATIGGP